MQSHYYDEYDVIEREHWWFRARRTILRSVLESSGLWGRGLRVLDVGSGTGSMLDFLGHGFAFLGSDQESAAVRFAARRHPGRIIQCAVTALPIGEHSFDVVTAFDLIEHLTDEGPALRELHRVLRPGGHAVLTVPALQLLWGQHDAINEHVRRYRRGPLRQRLVEAGFEILRASYFNALLFAPIAAVRIGRRLAGRLIDTTRRDGSGRLKSDFSLFGSPWIGVMLERVMALEAPLVRRVDLPIGVSIVAVARKPI